MFEEVGAEHAVERRVAEGQPGGVGSERSGGTRHRRPETVGVEVDGRHAGTGGLERAAVVAGPATKVEHVGAGEREGEVLDGADRHLLVERPRLLALGEEHPEHGEAARPLGATAPGHHGGVGTQGGHSGRPVGERGSER